MPYAKGQSGNPKGRPKQTAEQKSQKEQFQRLLKSSTVEALQSIIQIANDRYNKDRFNRYNEWVQNNPDKAKAEGLEELPIIPLHGLRHSCATLLNYLEVNIIEISKTLGHSTCSTTMNIYAHSFEEQQEEVATKVNEFLRLNA